MWIQADGQWANMQQVTTVTFSKDETGPFLQLHFARIGDGIVVRNPADMDKIQEYIKNQEYVEAHDYK